MSDQGWRRSPEECAAHIKEATAWITQHMSGASDRAVWSQLEPGGVASKLPATPPDHPELLSDVLHDLQNIIEPGMVRWDAPGWMAWFPSNAHPDAILGDLLASVSAQQGMLWASSPACTELETRMLEWLRTAMGLPQCFAEDGIGGGVLQDTASSAILACMVAARDRATLGRSSRDGGMACAGLTAYTSEQAHSSALKAAGICGIGRDNLRLIPTDHKYQMNVAALASAMEQDIAAGLLPCFCSATVGTTGCGAIDPVESIGKLCSEHGVWFHVDAAWAGTAALSTVFQGDIVAGAEYADSWNFNPHKWMGASFDCSCLWLADRAPLIESMSIDPEYLRNSATDAGHVIDYRDWHIQLGRRFRSLKLWVLLRMTGVAALADMVEFHVSLADVVRKRIDASSRLELAAPQRLSLLCIQHVDGDAQTQRLLDEVNADGRFAVTHCKLDGRLVIRVAIGTLSTTLDDVQALCQLLDERA
jgi:aromatic-L-amino-acid decarboxylase